MDKSVLKKATSDSPEPTQGPLYREIANMTFNDEKTARKMAEWLMDRMKGAKKQYTIIKSLKVIKHCAGSGHPDFQKAMQKQSDELRTYSNWKGPLDPVMGDMLNEQVRSGAKEAFEAIFSEQKQSVVRNSMESFGSTPAAGAGTTQGMGGFRDPTANIGGMGSNKLAEAMAKQQTGGTGGGMLGALGAAMSSKLGIGGSGSPTGAQMYPGMMAGDVPAQPFSAAPVAQAPAPTLPDAGTSGSPPKWGFTADGAGASAAPAIRDSEVLTPMQRIIDKYVSKSSSPGRSEITAFIREATSCDTEEGDELSARLDEKLDPKTVDKWQVRLNTLVLIEALVSRGNEEVAEYFTDNPEDIQKNVNVVQTTVKEKAKKVLDMLGVASVSATKKTAFNQQLPISQGPGTGDQLGVEISLDPNAMAAPAESAAKPKKEMKLKKRKKKSTAGEDSPVAAAAAAAAAAGGGVGLFDFATAGAAVETQPQPAAAPKPQAPAGHADLFAMLQKQHQAAAAAAAPAAAPEVPAAPAAPAADAQAQQLTQLQQQQQLFAMLQAQHQQQAAPAPPATPPPAAPAASGFDFLSGAPSAAATPPAAFATPTPAATPAVGAPTPGGTQVQATGFDSLFAGAPAAATATPTNTVPAPTPAPTPLNHVPSTGTFDFLGTPSSASGNAGAAPTPFSSPMMPDANKPTAAPVDFMAQLMAGGAAAAAPAVPAAPHASPVAPQQPAGIDFMSQLGGAPAAAPVLAQPAAQADFMAQLMGGAAAAPAAVPAAPAPVAPAAPAAAPAGNDMMAQLLAQQQALQAQIAALQAQQAAAQPTAPPQNPPGAFPF